jgi:tight adherence protein C
MEILAVMLAFASVFLIVFGLRTKAVDPVEARLQAVRTGIGPRNAVLSQPFIRRAAAPMAGSVVRFIMRLLPSTWVSETQQKLAWAGNFMSLPTFILIWACVAVCLGVLGFLFANTFGWGFLGLAIAAAVGFAVGALLPQLWLRARVSDRRYQTRKGLPDALDLMTTSVEAGLSLDSAMVRVAEFQRGPFQDELAVAMQEMTLGKSRREALEQLSERLNVPEVISFIQTINQAEITGAPIGQVLRAQAQQVRIKRRQAAETQAQRAPLLMIIPLVFFILPSMFVFLVAPAALTIIDLLTNSSVFNR